MIRLAWAPLLLAATLGAQPLPFKIVFADQKENPPYNKSLGYGYDYKTAPGKTEPGDGKPFYFSVAVPEGNFNVTVGLGDAAAACATSVKAESRRLMLDEVASAAGQIVTRTFTVNVRNSRLAGGGEVRLKEREIGSLEWDEKLTLEFNGAHPCLASVEVSRADVPTIFLAGDSTVTDQPRDPIASWGQMLTRFFLPGVAVANYAESGESLKSFIAEGRLEKLLSQIKKGDYLFVQFGHNDMKENWPQTYAEAGTTYKQYLRVFIAEARRRGAQPVLVSPMHRRFFDGPRIRNTLAGYPDAVREVAREEKLPLIDLNAMSANFYEAMGPDKSPVAFAPGDQTHHSAYGAYELARCVIEGIRTSKLDLVKYLDRSMGAFHPARPDASDTVTFLPSPPLPDPPHRPATLWLIGDSTVRNGSGDGRNGQWGWGDKLAPYFDPAKMAVMNKALGGRSSRTYISEGHWEEVLPLIRPGDVVMMQFGHNDGSLPDEPSRARGSLKGTGEESQEIANPITKRHETVYTYGWYLRKYIAETKAAGATAIVCSPIPRQNWKDGHVQRGEASYAGWAREIASAAGVPFVDLNTVIANKLDSLGEKQVEPLFFGDHTHTSLPGAELNAACVVKGVKTLPNSPLASFLSPKAGEPNSCDVNP